MWFDQIFRTKGGWLAIHLFFIIIFSILTNWYNWAYTAVAICFIYPVILILTLTAFAFINIFKSKNK